jgi:hypothetical protein
LTVDCTTESVGWPLGALTSNKAEGRSSAQGAVHQMLGASKAVFLPDFRIIAIHFCLVASAIGVVSILFFWILWAASIGTPKAILIRYLQTVLWSALPIGLALFGAYLIFNMVESLPDSSPILRLLEGLLLYGVTYATLYLGTVLRTAIKPHDRPVEPTFLRLPALTISFIFGLVLVGFWYRLFASHVDSFDGARFLFAICLATILTIGWLIHPSDSTASKYSTLPVTHASFTSEPDSTSPNTTPPQVNQHLPAISPQAFSNSGPPKGMALKLKRSERHGALGKMIFALDARMEVSAETRALIQKYKLGSHIIYESANREAYAKAAKAHLDNSRDDTSIFDSPGQQALGAGKAFYRIARSAISAAASALSLRITVDSLIKGHHIECKDMNELMDAEAEIKQAAINLKAHLEAATTFTGQEEIFEL